MSERIHVLAHQIFGKSSVEECDLSEIRDLVNRYPFFAPAQFLLLEKLKQDNDPGYQAQLQKSVLYYHNPLEFEYFINSERFYTDESILKDSIKEDENLNETLTVTENKPAVNETSQLHIEEAQIQTNDLDTELLNDEQNAVDNGTSYSSEEVIFIAEENMNEEDEDQDEVSIEIESEADPEFKLRSVPSDIKELVSDIQTPNAQPQTPNSEQDTLAFEPFHTVDYFASQGIKLSQEEVPKDKFGKQLKSFTEWLKTMKRLPAKEIAVPTDPHTEQKVQHLAEDSVHEADIVTEAMAEVWLKQGNRQKALETYSKLSLQNPSKRAYFATLIENLKRS